MKKHSLRRATTTLLHLLVLAAVIASSVLIVEPAPAYATAPDAPPSGRQQLAFTEEETGTPFQQALRESIKERKKLSLPAPASETYEYDVAAAPDLNKAAGKAVDHVTITGKTVLNFDNPEQAGYDKWPDLVVDDILPEGAAGSVTPGDYSQSIRDALEQEFPGIWKKYEFGHEPRTYVFEETYEIYPQDSAQASTLAAVAVSDSTTLDEVLLGFTLGARIDYLFNPKWRVCLFGKCAIVAEAKAGLTLDWAFGLRIPARVSLTAPDVMAAGNPYMLTSTFTALNWGAADYARVGVHPGNGKEFALYYYFFAGVRVIILGKTVVNWAVETRFDRSKDCSLPVGQGGCAIPWQTETLPPADTGLQWSVLGIVTLGIGLKITPAIGSSTIKANWAADGDAIGSGQITYGGQGNPTQFGPMQAGDYGPTNNAHIRLTDFRYKFNQFSISLDGALEVKVLKYSGKVEDFHIYTLTLPSLPDGPGVGVHAGTDGVVERFIPVTSNMPSSHPTTTIALAGTPGSNNWYRSDVQVTLTATPGSGSGLKTYYSFNGTSWSQYTVPLTLSTEGAATLYYYSTDSAGTEPAHTQLIKIDKTPPAISIASPLAQDYVHTANLALDWTVTENVSGIAVQSAAFDGAPVVSGQVVDLFFLSLGPHTLAVNAADEAGNSASASVTFNVVADIYSLIAARQRVQELGWIVKQGTLKSLDAKLNAAKAAIERGQFNSARNQLKAFLNELNAQKGKAVSQQAYDLLRADALYVISRLP